MLGLTLLTGEPLMCVIIFVGKSNKDLVELRIDPFCNSILGDQNDNDFILQNTGKS